MQAIGTGVYVLMRHMASIAANREVLRNRDDAMDRFLRICQFHAQKLARDIQEGFALELLSEIAGKHESALHNFSLALVQLDVLSNPAVGAGGGSVPVPLSKTTYIDDIMSSDTKCAIARLAHQCRKYRKPLFEDQADGELAEFIEGVRRKENCELE